MCALLVETRQPDLQFSERRSLQIFENNFSRLLIEHAIVLELVFGHYLSKQSFELLVRWGLFKL